MSDDPLTLFVAVEGILATWIFAEGCSVVSSPPQLIDELFAAADDAVERSNEAERLETKTSIRKMLRHGSYHPSGRGKPASEYLLGAAAKGELPLINNLVDINNLVSLKCLLPISLVDVDLAGTRNFKVRRGNEGEAYVFNASRQILTLRDILLLSRMPDDSPCASPIKDSHATKVHEGTRSVLGVIYTPAALRETTGEAAVLMADMLKKWGGAELCRWGSVEKSSRRS